MADIIGQLIQQPFLQTFLFLALFFFFLIEAENSQKPTMPTFLQLIMAHEAQETSTRRKGAWKSSAPILKQVCLKYSLNTD